MPHQKIAVFGVFGVGNFGNEATLESYLSQLRPTKPDATLICICAKPATVEQDYRIPAIAMDSLPSTPARTGNGFMERLLGRFRRLRFVTEFIRWGRTFAQIRLCDSLVIPGTGILDDFGTSPNGLPYHLFRWCLAARLCRVQIRFISIGAGPILHARSRRLMTWAIRLAHQRSFRDQESKDFVCGLGVRADRDLVMPDLAFCHPQAGHLVPANPTGNLRVGLGVMTYLGWSGQEAEGKPVFEKYIGNLTRFTRWLLEQDYEVSLMIGELNDQQAVEALLAGLRSTVNPAILARLTAKPQASMGDFLDRVSTLDVVVATRFHNVVGSLCRGKPVISIGYASKNDRLMDDFGLQEYYQHIDHLEVDRLVAQFKSLLARRAELSQQITTRAERYRNLLLEHLSGTG